MNEYQINSNVYVGNYYGLLIKKSQSVGMSEYVFLDATCPCGVTHNLTFPDILNGKNIPHKCGNPNHWAFYIKEE